VSPHSHHPPTTDEPITALPAADALAPSRDWEHVRRARLQLAIWIILAAFCVIVTFSPLRSGYTSGPRFDAPTDVDLYEAEIARMRQGESYYQAAATELRSRGYPTASIFNWRTPLPMWLVAKLPGRGGQALLAVLAGGLVLASFLWIAGEAGLLAGAIAAVLLFGAVMPCFLGPLYVMPVLWAGVLIGLSVAAYGFDRPAAGCVLGLAALFCRDLAGPYAVACLLLAWRQGRRRETMAWLVGLAVYAAFFAWHVAQVQSLLGPNEVAHEEGWLQLGGAPFVISTVQMNAFLLVGPQWLAALYLVAALAGVTAWDSPAGQRVGYVLAMYVGLFAVVGQPFNQYWGAMLAPLFALGVALAPQTFRKLASIALAPTAAS
jgi:hypothetical protein